LYTIDDLFPFLAFNHFFGFLSQPSKLKTTDWKWNVNNLDGWLKNPKKWLKAKNGKRSSMVYKLKKKQDRDNIIAYLQTLK
jgi:cytochrome c2